MPQWILSYIMAIPEVDAAVAHILHEQEQHSYEAGFCAGREEGRAFGYEDGYHDGTEGTRLADYG